MISSKGYYCKLTSCTIAYYCSTTLESIEPILLQMSAKVILLDKLFGTALAS